MSSRFTLPTRETRRPSAPRSRSIVAAPMSRCARESAGRPYPGNASERTPGDRYIGYDDSGQATRSAPRRSASTVSGTRRSRMYSRLSRALFFTDWFTFGCTTPTVSFGASAIRARTWRSRSSPCTPTSASTAAVATIAARGAGPRSRRAAMASASVAFTSTTSAAMAYTPASAASCATGSVRTCV